MKTPEQVLNPYIETPFRHTKIVDPANAIKAIEEYAEQFDTTFTHNDIPEISKTDPLFSDDVIVFADGLTHLAFYDFHYNEWTFHTERTGIIDPEEFKWKYIRR